MRKGLLALAFAVGSANAGTVPITDDHLTIDGIINESAWEQALVIDDFNQIEPVENTPPNTDCTVRVLLSGDNIVFAGYMENQPNIEPAILDADQGNTDMVQIAMGTMGISNVHSYRVYANGNCVDLLNGDPLWSQDKDCKVTVGEGWWSFELSLSLEQMLHTNEVRQEWPVQIHRRDMLTRRTDYAFACTRDQAANFEQYHGLLVFDTDVKAGLFKLLASVAYNSDNLWQNPFSGRILYMARDQQVQIAWKPTFLSTGADPSFIGHTRFERQLSEPREIFSIRGTPWINMFYSRRISDEVEGVARYQLKRGKVSFDMISALEDRMFTYMIGSVRTAPRSEVGGAISNILGGYTAGCVFFSHEIIRNVFLKGNFFEANGSNEPGDESWSAELGYSDSEMYFRAGLRNLGPGFDINQTGILSTNDRIRRWADVGFTLTRNNYVFDSVVFNAYIVHGTRHDGTDMGAYFGPKLNLYFNNNWYACLSASTLGDRFFDGEGENLYYFPSLSLYLRNDSRRSVTGNLTATIEEGFNFEDLNVFEAQVLEGNLSYKRNNLRFWCSSQYRHETSDQGVDDRQRWVMGFSKTSRHLGCGIDVDYNNVDSSIVGSGRLTWFPFPGKPDDKVTLGFKKGDEAKYFITVNSRIL